MGGMEAVLLVVELLLLFQATTTRAQMQLQHWLVDCPSLCVCDVQLRASCTGRRLYSIHTGVSSLVQALDLSNNSIAHLEDRQLSRAGLTRLKYLNLSMNAISEIGSNAFHDLRNLTILDLSMNHIDYIEPDTFYYNQKLQVLHLGGNKFNLHVPTLHSISLVSLDLSRCRINQILKQTFQGLEQLRKLDLSNNMLTELDKDVLRPMRFLQKLALGRNNWICHESMIRLKMYVHRMNIETHPICNNTDRPSRNFDQIFRQELVSANRDLRMAKEIYDSWDVNKRPKLEEVVHDERKREQLESGSPGIFASTLASSVSPFWFLLIGFLLGSGATMVVTYLWLSTTISCLIPRIRRAGTADSTDASSQRVSLLRHLWQQENIANTEESNNGGGNTPTTTTTMTTMTTTTTTSTTSILPTCPGTPPPPYREVMLHRNLYPRAAMAAAAAQQRTGRTHHHHHHPQPHDTPTTTATYNI